MDINEPLAQAALAGSNVGTVYAGSNQRTASIVPGGSTNVLQQNINRRDLAGNQNQAAADTSNIEDASGRRVRLRPKPGAAEKIYGPEYAIQGKILSKTRGMVWPYQPTITYQQDVEYQTMDLVHTNQEILSYQRTRALKLTVDGLFTVQSNDEGIYATACIRFLQTVTKMYFGGSEGSSVAGLQGTPPPVLLFDALGQYMFNCLPVVVTQFTVGLPNDVDYVPVDFGSLGDLPEAARNSLANQVSRVNQPSLKQNDNIAWLPAVFNIQVQLTVQNTPRRLRQFDLDKFRTGELIRNGGWI